MMPAEVVEVRRAICAAANCAGADFSDPCATCHGHWGQYNASLCRKGLGDKVAAIATPIARVLKLGCIDPATKEPRPESNCAKRKAKLNELGEKLGL